MPHFLDRFYNTPFPINFIHKKTSPFQKEKVLLQPQLKIPLLIRSFDCLFIRDHEATKAQSFAVKPQSHNAGGSK